MRHQPKSCNTKDVQRTSRRHIGVFGVAFLMIQSPSSAAFVALFTCVLTIISGVQVWAFIASERAFVTLARPDLSLIAKAPKISRFKSRWQLLTPVATPL